MNSPGHIPELTDRTIRFASFAEQLTNSIAPPCVEPAGSRSRPERQPLDSFQVSVFPGCPVFVTNSFFLDKRSRPQVASRQYFGSSLPRRNSHNSKFSHPGFPGKSQPGLERHLCRPKVRIPFFSRALRHLTLDATAGSSMRPAVRMLSPPIHPAIRRKRIPAVRVPTHGSTFPNPQAIRRSAWISAQY